MVITPRRESVVVLPSSEWVPVVPFIKGPMWFALPLRKPTKGTSGRHLIPDSDALIRVTTPQVQVPNVIPQTEEPPRIIRVSVPRTTLLSYLPTDADKQPGEPTQGYSSHISEALAALGTSATVPAGLLNNLKTDRAIRFASYSNRCRFESWTFKCPTEEIRVTTPGSIKYPPP
ncbi:unnamed protein product [Rhizoctonia solani]|uniref:Uncharacterized protein n=1 Tax=Rhizoctonia solani TaxID=456999 RepID=A0A8H3A700_9AGAM|nr:unnamed protein product [Rhizoctonia solani]